MEVGKRKSYPTSTAAQKKGFPWIYCIHSDVVLRGRDKNSALFPVISLSAKYKSVVLSNFNGKTEVVLLGDKAVSGVICILLSLLFKVRCS